jgi:hypothetical protein
LSDALRTPLQYRYVNVRRTFGKQSEANLLEPPWSACVSKVGPAPSRRIRPPAKAINNVKNNSAELMTDAISTQLAAMSATREEIRSNLERLRRAKRRYGHCDLTPGRQAQLRQKVDHLRKDLNQLLIGAGTIAPDDPQLGLLLDVARRVLNDCNEILGLCSEFSSAPPKPIK